MAKARSRFGGASLAKAIGSICGKAAGGVGRELRAHFRGLFTGMEALEIRQMLSGDYIVTLTAPAIPSTVYSSTPQANWQLHLTGGNVTTSDNGFTQSMTIHSDALSAAELAK